MNDFVAFGADFCVAYAWFLSKKNMFNCNCTILSHEVDCTRWGIDSMVLAMVQGMCREGEMHLFGR